MLPIHPAVILKQQIGGDRAAIRRFCQRTRINERLLRAVLTGQRPIKPPLARRLGRLFKTGDWYWLALQWRYEHAVAPARGFSARIGDPGRRMLGLEPSLA